MITPAKIKIAAKYLENAETIAKAAERAGLPFAVACGRMGTPPRVSVNTTRRLTHSSDLTREGLAVKATRKIVRNDIDHRQVRLLDKVWPRLEWVGDCLEYMGRLTFNGYGEVDEWHEGVSRHLRVHRLVYALTVGPIPDGLNVLHSCDNRKCTNPDHLRAGTQRENIQEASQRGRLDNGMSARTHCPQGHPYDETNTYVNRRGSRECRACTNQRRNKYRNPERHAAQQRAYYWRKKAEREAS